MLKTNMAAFNPEREKLSGNYRGVIEDNNDPLKMGRCRIRIWGIHTEVKEPSETEGIPTDELPWAEPALGLFAGSISGFGAWTVPVKGSHVFLFFENGNILQPRYFATVPGITKTKPDPKKGFSDPDGVFPTDSRLGETDFHRLTRNEDMDGTIVQFKNDNLDTGVQTALGSPWNEPESAYNAEYPHNNVFVTQAGITIELDNTPNNPRIHIWHPSNSYIEVDKDGNTVMRCGKDNFEIVMGDKNIHIKSGLNTTIDMDETRYVKNNQIVKIDSEHNETIGKNRTEVIGMNETRNVGMNQTETIAMNQTENIGVNETRTVGVAQVENIGATVARNVGATVMDIAGGMHTIIAPIINLNP